MAVEGAKGGEEAVGDGDWEEAPQAGGGQCEASDFVGEPDGEGPSAAGPSVAVAAKDASGAEGLSLRAALVKTVQKAVLNETPTTWQYGHGVSLSRWAMAVHSSALR